MSDTSGPMSPQPFAYYDPESSSVKTSQTTFDLGLTEPSPTLPPWGSMRGGELFEHPTPAHPISAHGCSLSLLPTPTARDWKDGGAVNSNVPTNALLGRQVWKLLPTPRATDGTNGGPNQRGSSGDLMLPSAVQSLGASTNPRFANGKPSSDATPPLPLNSDATETPD